MEFPYLSPELTEIIEDQTSKVSGCKAYQSDADSCYSGEN